MIETLFEDFDGYLEKQGYLAMGGQIIENRMNERRSRSWYST